MNILLLKESNAGEQRVALTPNDIKTLIEKKHRIFVESQAGSAAGFSDDEYASIGATVCRSPKTDQDYHALFTQKDIIVRAKRPNEYRERQEAKAYIPGTILIGALDPHDPHSNHIEEYKAAGIRSYSIDQMKLPTDHPMNVLAQMSRIAGQLALDDALEKLDRTPKKIVIIGFGTAGKSAFHHAINLGYTPHIIVNQQQKSIDIEQDGGVPIVIEKNTPLGQQQAIIQTHLANADIVITTARSSGKKSPLLIPISTLNEMQPGSVIIDMAIAEGGNVENSEHDKTLILGNNVIVSNTSGYPKVKPHKSSVIWSHATLQFIELLLSNRRVPLQSLS